jgi:hypothetical protein
MVETQEKSYLKVTREIQDGDNAFMEKCFYGWFLSDENNGSQLARCQYSAKRNIARLIANKKGGRKSAPLNIPAAKKYAWKQKGTQNAG